MNCIDELRRKGYSLSGYSMDTYYYLENNDAFDEEECEGLLAYLEMVYG